MLIYVGKYTCTHLHILVCRYTYRVLVDTLIHVDDHRDTHAPSWHICVAQQSHLSSLTSTPTFTQAYHHTYDSTSMCRWAHHPRNRAPPESQHAIRRHHHAQYTKCGGVFWLEVWRLRTTCRARNNAALYGGCLRKCVLMPRMEAGSGLRLGACAKVAELAAN